MGKLKIQIKDPKDFNENYNINVSDDQSNFVFDCNKKKNKSIQKLFCCHICGKMLSTRNGFTKHIRVHDGYRYVCRLEMCYTFFKTKDALREHTLIHTGERPLICNVCNKSFRQRKALYEHQNSMRPYNCKVCQRAFSHLATLKCHLRIHTGEKPYSCKVCKKAFVHCVQLKRHIRIHSGETPNVCNLCQRAFVHSSQLEKHMKIHTVEPPFVCDICQKGFDERRKIVRHLKTHAEQKPTCANCDRKFCRKDHLKVHLSKCFKEPKTIHNSGINIKV